jgi:hypothetical protein
MSNSLRQVEAGLAAIHVASEVPAARAALREAEETLKRVMEAHVARLVGPLQALSLPFPSDDTAVSSLAVDLVARSSTSITTKRAEAREPLEVIYERLRGFNGTATEFVTLLVRLRIQRVGEKGSSDELVVNFFENGPSLEDFLEEEAEVE